MTELSVLIVNYNSWRVCLGALRSLRANAPRRADGSAMPFEVIVVDSGHDPAVVEAFVEREADFQRVNAKAAQANNGANSSEAGREIDIATTLSVN